MSVKVGVVGVGMIGQDHIRRISQVLAGAEVVAVTDVNAEQAQRVADQLPRAKVFGSGQELIASDDVDAVIVTSFPGTHEEYVLAGIKAGKQVFCEKPLATTRAACERIVDAEVAAGRRLVMVGFMRRYDAAYTAMKKTLTDGAIGAPLIYYSGHRNPTVPPSFDTGGLIVDTCVHDIDISRWLLDSEIAAVRTVSPRRHSQASVALQDPLLLLLEMASGVVVNVEAAVNIGYGYDIRGELLGETGSIELAESNQVIIKTVGRYGGRVPEGWRERFLRAYDEELQDWVNAVSNGTSTGPSAWDGYAATVACDAALEAFQTGDRIEISLRDKPNLYLDRATSVA